MQVRTRLSAQVIAEYLSSGLWDKTSLSAYWDRNASVDPDRTALADGHRSLPWSDCKTWTDRFALALIRAGLERGEALLVQLPNWLELPLIRMACEKAGILSLPLARTLRQNELACCLGSTGARALVIPDVYRGFDYGAMADGLKKQFRQLRYVFVVGKESRHGTIAVEEMVRDGLDGEDIRPLARRRFRSDEISMINATTGSSGPPKFVAYTAAARLLYGKSYVEVLNLSREDVLAALSPAAGGPNIPVYFAAPQVGAKSVFLEPFEADAAFKLIEREKVTLACLGPAQLSLLVRHFTPGRYHLSSVRFWLSVGAPLPPELARETEAKLGATVLNTYGAVDWGGVVFTAPTDLPEVRYGTVGRPYVGTEVRLVMENGQPAGPGETGELQGRGPSCASGRFHDDETAGTAWTADGWLRLGDLGQWDDKGNLILIGRKDDVIIRGGQNIQPSEIENHLLAHPQVKQAAVIGMPDRIMGQKVCAYVVPRTSGGISFEEIVSFLRSRQLAVYKLPERLEVVQALPMVSDTKVDKKFLAADVIEKLRQAGGT